MIILKHKKVLLIIPAFNEEENILNTYQSIKKYNEESKNKYDVLVVNDGSTDKTKEILKDNHINHVNLIHNLGIGGAVQTGYKYAYYHNYDIAVQFDGDGQHDVNYVENIIRPILDGKVGMVIGSRFINKSSYGFKSTVSRRMGIKVLSFFIKFASKQKIYDTTSGFRACNRELIQYFAMSYPIEYPEPITTTEIIKMGYQVEEVEVSMNERQGGISSIRAWKDVYYMLNVCLSLLIAKFRRYK